MTDLDLLPNVNVTAQTAEQFKRLQLDLQNHKGNPNIMGGLRIWLNEYLQWVESADNLLASQFAAGGWLDRLYSPHYWHIRELGPESLRFIPLLQMEAGRQLAWLDEVVTEVETLVQEAEMADRSETRAVLDTNVHLHYRPFDQVTEWHEVVGAGSALDRVQLVVPLPVVRELDDKKNLAKEQLAGRAASRLRTMRRLLAGRGTGPVEVRSGVRLSVFVSRRRLEVANADEVILACVERLSVRPGGPVVLVTGDLSMQLRAEAQGVKVRFMPDSLRMPLGASLVAEDPNLTN